MSGSINSTFMEQIMKQVINVEDLIWFVEKYDRYYKEHNGKCYLNPASLKDAFQKLIIMKGYFIDD